MPPTLSLFALFLFLTLFQHLSRSLALLQPKNIFCHALRSPPLTEATFKHEIDARVAASRREETNLIPESRDALPRGEFFVFKLPHDASLQLNLTAFILLSSSRS
ncbi:hypothetical protein IE53DRAFT_391216 [Violaceomyces palustris]|uniref:Uncharacterized protein n=1 Tax=Violaceomyces palustris TaxID=1673888 RepID=A0ACD0NLH3_9BASI|nr:hypothetical protein IE53DRAFT_391216 [Violaceomyces palustris]